MRRSAPCGWRWRCGNGPPSWSSAGTASGYELDLGIGIAKGYATIGAIGFEGRWDYGAIGTVTNLAARLCGEAKPGQILISPRLLPEVERVLEVEEVGLLAIKGLARPVKALNIVRLRDPA